MKVTSWTLREIRTKKAGHPRRVTATTRKRQTREMPEAGGGRNSESPAARQGPKEAYSLRR